jgi:hypothetical protein
MGRTLFLGDSHSTGYYQKGDELQWWTDANYAEAYAKEFDKEVVIYAQPGGCNKKYPIWLRAMFDYYDDIDEVFVQSTYWNRYLLGCSRNLDIGDGMKASHFSYGPNPPPATEQDNIHRWTDERVTEDYVEMVEQCRPEHFENFKGFTYEEQGITADWGPFKEKYQYTKLWHESVTHLQYREYCTDLFVMDRLCDEYGVDLHLWSINNRVFIPNHLDFFGPLKRVKRAKSSAEEFIELTHSWNIEDDTTDGEHYPKSTHDIIGKEFIPYIKNLTKT